MLPVIQDGFGDRDPADFLINNIDEKRLQKRQELSRPVLEGFWAWVEETSAKYTANESLKTALTYRTLPVLLLPARCVSPT